MNKKEAAMDKGTEKTVRAIYDEMKKEQTNLDWFWLKREAESLLSGGSPSGSVGIALLEHLKKAGKC